MPESILEIECSNPELVKKSLDADAKAEKGSRVVITAEKNSIKIKISTDKPNKIRAIENSYKKLVEMLNRIDKL